ncbi:deoxyribonuclease-2-beta-like [Neolamprologus brichardi]|uniref:deoxyribonuclease-2-beta-like n=1 Tax=Neolamprologus brichardi TaxID=32507 RepID=UPI0003EC4976|nr:deoxyribonuclease-2-beta-like [Neolamprologus brichardi]
MDALWMIVLTVGLLGSHCEGAISCKNENGVPVDWFILYKKPAGFDYVYIDSTNNELQKNNKPVNHQAGVLAHTLNPCFEKSPDSGFIAYNDQTPSCNALQEYGHSKGVVMMDKENVVWLLHSTPKFPNGDESNNFFPESGETKAQIFMCVTLKSTESAQIAQHLKDINAHIFKEHNPEKLKDSSKEQRKRPYHKDLSSAGGQKFTRFVKQISENGDCEEGDLYFYIADTLESNLYIQTWRSNPEDTDITDENQNLYNIVEVKAGGSKWEYRSDHSKWCVSDSKAWMCIGDSNREPSQFERPGGALCINSKHVANAFRTIKTEDSSMEPPLKKTLKRSSG